MLSLCADVLSKTLDLALKRYMAQTYNEVVKSKAKKPKRDMLQSSKNAVKSNTLRPCHQTPNLMGLVPRPIQTTVITVGSVFTGLSSDALAFVELGARCRHVFGCDVFLPAKVFGLSKFHYTTWFDDVLGTPFPGKAPPVMLLTAGVPCQPFSLQGNRLGSADARALLIVPRLDYVVRTQPMMCIFESVPIFASSSTFQMMAKVLKTSGFNVGWEVLDAQHYGLPQHRERLYIWASLKRAQRYRFEVPDTSDFMLPLAAFLRVSTQRRLNMSKRGNKR